VVSSELARFTRADPTREESVVNTVFVVPSADHLSIEVAPL
jgi:hypothetical protein